MNLPKLNRWLPGWLSPALGALLLIVGLIVFLVWQTAAAVHSQRAAGAAILSNYAEVAADELIRRSTAQIGYRTYFLTLSELQKAADADALSVCATAAAWAQSDHPSRRAAAQMIAEVELIQAGKGHCGSTAEQRLIEDLGALDRNPDARQEAFGSFRYPLDGGIATWAYMPWREGWIAFAASREALAHQFARVIAETRLLPKSLNLVDDHPAGLTVEIRDPADHVIHAARSITLPATRIEGHYGDDYGGALYGYSVHIGIEPTLAGILVAQSPPVVGLSYILGLAALAILLGGIAIYQLAQERALVRQRSDFVARVSHELRTPLAQISIYADTLVLGRSRSEDDRQHALRVIQREARRLSHLVGNILSFSARAKGVGTVTAVTPVARAIVEASEAARLMAPAHSFEFVGLKQALHAGIDPDGLHLALLNLLDNAAKYSPVDQPIKIEVQTHGDRISICVDDGGPGIPAAERELVRQAFYRLHRDRDSATPGTGIGLAVVTETLSACGGELILTDSQRGGTRASLLIPRATAA